MTKINKARIECKIMTMIENGRKEITTKKELKKYAIGSLISYLNASDVFKQGGFLTKVADEYFTFITPDFETKYRVKYTNVKKMWVGDVFETKNDIVSIIASDKFPTKTEVKINDIIIYYAKDGYDAKRFRCTERYKKIVQWNEYFNA